MTCCSSTRLSTSLKGKRQNQLTDEHINRIIETYQNRPAKPIERYARRVKMKEIEANDFNLNISRYVSTAVSGRGDRSGLDASRVGRNRQVDSEGNSQAQHISEGAWVAPIAIKRIEIRDASKPPGSPSPAAHDTCKLPKNTPGPATHPATTQPGVVKRTPARPSYGTSIRSRSTFSCAPGRRWSSRWPATPSRSGRHCFPAFRPAGCDPWLRPERKFQPAAGRLPPDCGNRVSPSAYRPLPGKPPCSLAVTLANRINGLAMREEPANRPADATRRLPPRAAAAPSRGLAADRSRPSAGKVTPPECPAPSAAGS